MYATKSVFLVLIIKIFLSTNNVELRRSVPKFPGSPFPLPQTYAVSDNQFYIDEQMFQFQLNDTSFDCDLLEYAFRRYYKIIFTPVDYEIVKNRKLNIRKVKTKKARDIRQNTATISNVEIFVDGKCEDYPNLESDESCI